jgi:hypothetical protein
LRWLALLGSLLLRFAIDDGKHLFRADAIRYRRASRLYAASSPKFGPIALAPPPPASQPTPEERDPKQTTAGAITAAVDNRRGREMHRTP